MIKIPSYIFDEVALIDKEVSDDRKYRVKTNMVPLLMVF